MVHTIDAAIAALAAQQHGYFTRFQAIELGYSDRMIARRLAAGRWCVIEPGVYSIAGVPMTKEGRAMAAVLATGPVAMLSFLSAAAIWKAIPRWPDRIDLTVPNGDHHAARAGRFVHQARGLRERDRRTIDGLPVTCPERTLVDIAGVLPPKTLAAAIDNMITAGHTRADRVLRYVEERGLTRRKGAGKLKKLLIDRLRGVPESELERRFLRSAAIMGLPEPVRQKRVARYRIDFAYPAEMIMVEADGWLGHRTPEHLRRDALRQNALVLRGSQPVRITWDEALPGTASMLALKELLHRRGSQAVAVRGSLR